MRRRPPGADVEVPGHPLPRAGRRAVEREVPAVHLDVFALGLADAERERGRRVLAIPGVPEVGFGLSRPEESMRRRKRGNRSAGGFDCDDAVGGPEPHRPLVRRAAKLIVLPVVADVTPHNFGRGLDGEAGEAGVVLVGDRRLIGLRDHLLPIRFVPL